MSETESSYKKNICSLGELAEGFQNGIGKGKKFYGSGIKVANIGDLYTSHTFLPLKYSLLQCNNKEITKYRLKRGDILFVRSSLKKEGVAFCSSYESEDECLFSSFMIRITCDSIKVYSPFLTYQLRSPSGRSQLLARSNTSTITNISQNGLKKVNVWLPPLETQKRIVELLDRAQTLIDKRKEQIALMDQLIQSLFYDMFGDPVLNPMGWEVKIFKDFLNNIDSGWSPKCLAYPANENKWGVLKLSAVTGGRYNSSQNKQLPDDVFPKEKNEVKKGDLLFTRKNTKELVGSCAYVFDTPSKLQIPDIIFRLNTKNDVEKLYIWGLFNDQRFRSQITALASGSAASMINISKAKLNKLVIIVPPLELQNIFADRVKNIEFQKNAMTTSLHELENNFNSLMQRAFKGELINE